jgi:hypothetical protein
MKKFLIIGLLLGSPALADCNRYSPGGCAGTNNNGYYSGYGINDAVKSQSEA